MLPAAVTREQERMIDELCTSHDPFSDADVTKFRDSFSDEEWATWMAVKRRAFRHAIGSAIVTRHTLEAAEALGLSVENVQELRTDLFNALNGRSNEEESLPRRYNPRGILLDQNLAQLEAVAVASALNEVDDLLSLSD